MHKIERYTIYSVALTILLSSYYVSTTEIESNIQSKFIFLIIAMLVFLIYAIVNETIKKYDRILVSKCKDIHALDQLCTKKNIYEYETVYPYFIKFVESSFSKQNINRDISKLKSTYDTYLNLNICNNIPNLKRIMNTYVLENIKECKSKLDFELNEEFATNGYKNKFIECLNIIKSLVANISEQVNSPKKIG